MGVSSGLDARCALTVNGTRPVDVVAFSPLATHTLFTSTHVNLHLACVLAKMPLAFWPRKPRNPSCLRMSSRKAHGTSSVVPQPNVCGTRSATVDDCSRCSAAEPWHESAGPAAWGQ